VVLAVIMLRSLPLDLARFGTLDVCCKETALVSVEVFRGVF
jgi:hypothetical protein